VLLIDPLQNGVVGVAAAHWVRKSESCDKEQSAAALCKTYKKIREKTRNRGNPKKNSPGGCMLV